MGKYTLIVTIIVKIVTNYQFLGPKIALDYPEWAPFGPYCDLN